MIAAVKQVKQGATVRARSDHPAYHEEVGMPANVRDALAGNWQYPSFRQRKKGHPYGE